MQRFLAGALAKQVRGVNMLIHGKPGTGKSELASSLASHIEAKLFSVPCITRWGYQMDRKDRFSAYTLCQKVASSKEKCIILFDEVEDVFVKDYSEASGKAWINSILESNPVPAIWLSNDIDDIDPAYLRRFDYVLEMPEVTHDVRQAIARRYFDGICVDPAWLNKLSKQDSISPAQIEKAARVVGLAQQDGEVFDSEEIAETVLECSTNALGGKFSISRNLVATGYDLSYLNTNVDVNTMIEGLKAYPKATFCFHGAPGTGKTALAKHMAEQLGMKLTVKRASDITSKFIGGSEKNIAKMFREASDDNTVLLLDEADTFLSDRRDATHSWEISAINEMLTWMEDFEGIFICTTNLMEKLDQAALRRFAFKVRFDYLKPEQKRQLFKQELMRLNPQCDHVDEAMLRRVETLQSLAPGDFAVVSRQRAVIVGAPSASDMFVALQAESQAKGATSEKIGFLH
jgi:SpoVK/Ycf46/Vps4 family AAA+-type ATPase